MTDMLYPAAGGFGQPPGEPPYTMAMADWEPEDDGWDFDYDPLSDIQPFDQPIAEYKSTLVFADEVLEMTVNHTPTASDQWRWHDAHVIGLDRPQVNGQTTYEVGAIELFRDRSSGQVIGNYLPIADFTDLDLAESYYHTMQAQMHGRNLLHHEIPTFAEEQTRALGVMDVAWRPATELEVDAYDLLHGVAQYLTRDVPPPDLDEPLLQVGLEYGAVITPLQGRPDLLDKEAGAAALRQIGVESADWDATQNPPPFVDRENGTAFWIGVYQPDKDDPAQCVTSILSLRRDLDTGQVEAQLAPCAVGDWDKAYHVAEYLIGVVEKDGIERAFSTAEGMALASDQRALWETERGVRLERESADEWADRSHDAWEMDL